MPRPALNPREHVRGMNVNFHPSIWEALRRRAFAERTTISEQVRRAVDSYLAAARKKAGGKK